MEFNSYTFILAFMPAVVFLYYLLNLLHRRIGTWFFIVASMFFVGYADEKALYFMLLSMAFTYVLAILQRCVNKKRIISKVVLAMGVIVHVVILAIFKYTSFIVINMNRFFLLDVTFETLWVPIGISFMTFQQIAFLVDVYRGKITKLVLTDYVFYITFFPKLVQGPITDYIELTQQLYDKSRRYPNAEHIACGLWFFSVGLAKKVLIADVFAGAVSWGYDYAAGELTSMEAILAMLCFTLQIYFDFSGYSQMAIGLGKLLNITLANNFDAPYRAITISDFWKRWHISLTSFFRMYLYFPLGGSRKGKARTYVNTMIIFVVSGLWHGASWSFVVWGALHGVAMCIDKWLKSIVPPIRYGKRVVQGFSWLFTFILVNLLWVFFRAPSLNYALSFLGKIFCMDSFTVRDEFFASFEISEFSYLAGKLSWFAAILERVQGLEMLIFLGIAFVIAICNKEKWEQFRPTLLRSIGAMIFLLWSVISLSHVSSFIYGSF